MQLLRRWYIAAVVVAIFAGIGFYLGWQALRLNEKARDFLASKGIQAEKVSLGFGTVQLKGLKLKTAGSISAFEVKEAAVSYSLWGLLSGGTRSALRSLSFFEPKLVLDLDKSSGGRGSPETLFRQLPPGRYAFSRGSISLKYAQNRAEMAPELRLVGCLLADRVNGWVSASEEGITFHLEGRLLSDRPNAELDGSVNPQDETYELRLSAKDLDLSSELAGALYPQLSVKSGQADLSLRVQSGPQIYGTAQIKDVTLTAGSDPAWEVDGLNLTAKAGPDTIIIGKGEGSWNGVKFQISGQVVSFSSPRLALKLGVSRLEVKDIASLLSLNQKGLPSGSGSLAVTIEGPPKHLQLAGELDQWGILYNGESVKQLKLKFVRTESALAVRNISGLIGGGKFRGELTLGTQAPDQTVQGEFRLTGVDFAKIARLLKARDIAGHGDLRIRLQGNLKSPRWHLWYDSRGVHLGGHNLDNQRGELELGPQGTRIHSRWDEGEFSASSAQHFSQSFLKVNQGLLALGSSKEPFQGALNLVGRLSEINPRGELDLAGNQVALSGRLTCEPEGEPELEIVLTSNSFSTGEATMAVSLNISANSKQLRLRLTAADKESGRRLLEESLMLQGAFASQFLNYYKAVVDRAEAEINGVVQFSGSLQQPMVAVQLRAQQGRVSGFDSLKTEVSLQWSKGGLKIERLNLSRLSEQIFTIGGEWTEKSKLIRAEAQAIDAASFLSLFSASGQKLNGSLSYELTLSVEKTLPKFNVRFMLAQASVMDIPFDKIAGTLRGDLANIEDVSIALERDGNYNGFLQGAIPLGTEGEMNLEFKLEGNVLSVLPYLTDQVKGSSGRGRVVLQVGGSRERPVMQRVEAAFEEGELDLRFLPEKVSRLKGKVRLAEGSQFLEIRDVSGKMGEKEFFLENRREVKIKGEELQPLVMAELGVNLGVMVLSTGDAGIMLNIPDLMRSKEQGRFVCPKGGNGLYIAGPVDALLIKGICHINDVEFTFPPLKSRRAAGKDRISEILLAADWDLRAIVGRNVRYFRRQEYSIADIAEVELQIDEGTWLDFKGSMAQQRFYVQGSLQSHQGRLVYLNTEFEVEEIGLEVNTQNDPMPLVWGSARTTVYADTAGVATDIFLRSYTVDKLTGERRERGRWGEVRIELTSSDPNDNTPEKILAKLGYSLDNYNQKAAMFLTAGMDKILLGSLVRPLEREVRKSLRLDIFSLRPSFLGNLLTGNELALENGDRLSYLALLRGTEWTFGEYLLGNWLLFYTGELKTDKDQYEKETLGVKHRFGIEYRTRATNISMEYNYDDILGRKDRQFSIRRYFSF